mmetsp:Transcript_27289/g.70790  ORF Transcript_27289/g.70790 Transcript_27289/m.70790 type:complete len:209 (+) Transcript_27289:1643-2269(+)
MPFSCLHCLRKCQDHLIPTIGQDPISGRHCANHLRRHDVLHHFKPPPHHGTRVPEHVLHRPCRQQDLVNSTLLEPLHWHHHCRGGQVRADLESQHLPGVLVSHRERAGAPDHGFVEGDTDSDASGERVRSRGGSPNSPGSNPIVHLKTVHRFLGTIEPTKGLHSSPTHAKYEALVHKQEVLLTLDESTGIQRQRRPVHNHVGRSVPRS